MPQIPPRKPGELPRAREWNAIAEAYNAGAFGLTGPPGSGVPLSSGLVAIKNTTANDRARWDCMSLGDTTVELSDDGSEAVVFAAEVAGADKTPVILQEPIAAGRYGVGRIFGWTLAKLAQSTDAAHDRGTPNGINHNLDVDDSGPIQILSSASTTAASVRPVLLGNVGEASGAAEVQLGEATLTEDFGATTEGEASANVLVLDSGDPATGETIYDEVDAAAHLLNGDKCMVIHNGTNWYVIQPSCGPIQIEETGV
jgi:hypothetical protein